MASATATFTYNRTHTVTFVADNMRNVLGFIVNEAGLDPLNLSDDWKVIGQGVRTWLGTRDLLEITLEFYLPGSDSAADRWDFPINYDGSGVDDDMWVDKEHLRRTLTKAKPLPTSCKYRIVLITRPGRPDVPGFVTTTLRSTGNLESRSSGTVIATGDIMASIKHWR